MASSRRTVLPLPVGAPGRRARHSCVSEISEGEADDAGRDARRGLSGRAARALTTNERDVDRM